MQRNNGIMTFIIGRSGCGKTSFANEQIAGRKRVLAWDPDSQFCELPGFQRCETLQHLYQMTKGNKGDSRIAFQAINPNDFDIFCKIAFAWNLENPCAVIAEELSDMVSQGKACLGWGILIRRGRKYGVDVFALTQRPAETDKTTLGNCTRMVIFAPNTELDAEYIVKKIGVPAAQIPSKNFHYIVREKDGTLSKPLQTKA